MPSAIIEPMTKKAIRHEIARITGITDNWRNERGNKRLTQDHLKQICFYLDIDPYKLTRFGRSKPRRYRMMNAILRKADMEPQYDCTGGTFTNEELKEIARTAESYEPQDKPSLEDLTEHIKANSYADEELAREKANALLNNVRYGFTIDDVDVYQQVSCKVDK